MTATAKVLDWVRRADFTGDGCRHSQQTIADAIGMSRRTVIRALKQLETDGLVTVQRAGRNRRVCNVTRATNWSPSLRAPVLNRLADIRLQRARRAECHTQENSRPWKHATPLCSGSQLVNHKLWTRPRVTVEDPETVVLPIEVVRDRLDAGGWRPQGPDGKFRALCPAHNDRSNPALIVSEREDRSVGIYCLAACDTAAVVEALGLQMRDLFVPLTPGAPRPKPRKPRQPAMAPVDRVLLRQRELGYRCTRSPDLWVSTCRVCGGELWIHALMDDDDLKPTGPVTLSCRNGCYANGGRR